MDHGWAIGEETWRQDIAASFRLEGAAEPVCGPAREALRAGRWQQALTQALARRGRCPDDLKVARKGAAWKIALADELRQTCGANYTWLARELFLGKATTARFRVWQWRGEHPAPAPKPTTSLPNAF